MGLPVIVDDLRSESRFRPSSLLVESGMVSGLSVVIPASDGTFGVLEAHCLAQRRFSADDGIFFQSVANLLSAAVTRARMSEEIERTAQERTELNAVVAHDLKNSVAALMLGVEALRRAKLAEQAKQRTE